tara:strand:- start:555 stop:1037 length:483 start_codon:yes stop_codon:yes gene_type:complete
MSNLNLRTIVIPNVTISACKLRRPYEGNYGSQYGAHLTGEGLAEIGLKPATDGGFWYNSNAVYGKTAQAVAPVSIQDPDGNDIEDDLQNGATAHLLFELRDYPAGIRQDGTKFKKGTNARIVAVRAVSFDTKQSKQDLLSAALLEMDMSSEPASAEEVPF